MNFLEQLTQGLSPIKVLDIGMEHILYLPLDLTEDSAFLARFQPHTASDYEQAIDSYLAEQQAQVAWGGYLERRNLYRRSPLFQETESPRNIHLGIDLWAPANTPILAAWEGEVHSFAYNDNWGDYGPTIILEHTCNASKFYTLYGHLSLLSLEQLAEGQAVKRGQVIGSLGTAEVNGDYAPHLHFQVILDLQGKRGDYPGVCRMSELDFYRSNCPDPNLLLKIK